MAVPFGVEGGEQLDLSRDLSQAIFEYAPGQSIVAGGKLWTSAGIVRRENKDWIPRWYSVCENCGRYWESPSDEIGTCPDCGEAPSDAPRIQIEPRFGFVTQARHDSPQDSPPRTSWQGDTFVVKHGAIRTEASGRAHGVDFEVQERARLARINFGPQRRGFKICRFCGAGVPGYAKTPNAHLNVRTQKPCGGSFTIYSLAHRYETDVVRLVFKGSWPGSTPSEQLAIANSVLQAIIQGAAEALQIARDDIDGQIDGGIVGGSAAIVLVDAVPGGAGYSDLIARNVASVIAAGLRLADNCECGEETSCYQCLRTYSNQRLHDSLSRGLAARFLRGVIAGVSGDHSIDQVGSGGSAARIGDT
jgi:hypothetical protein